MYPNSPTYTEEVNKLIEEGRLAAEITNGQILRDLIDSHDTKEMREGVAYYLNENDILKKKRHYYKDGQKVTDNEGLKPNNRVPHNWHRILVDQKKSYIVGKAITFTSENEAEQPLLDDLADDEFNDMLGELVKNASNKGKEWLHPYIDEEGNFDYIIIPAEQAIPIYDQGKQKDLLYFIRFYPITVDGEERYKVELYTKTEVFYYIQQENGEYALDMDEPENPASHFYLGEQGYGWERVPFIKFKNNEEEVSDLKFYKDLVDDYDKRKSNISDNFDEIQELIYVLKGYEGTDLSEFMQNLLYYKAINVEGDTDGGDAKTLQNEVPMQSGETYMSRTEEDIWTFGQGVNPKTDKFGNNPTGVALRFLYSLLDLKADHIENKFRPAIKTFLWFYAEYLSISRQGELDQDAVAMTFNRNMITNELEKVNMANTSQGVISNQSVYEHHPLAAKDEKERVRQEQDEYSRNLPSVEDDDDDTE